MRRMSFGLVRERLMRGSVRLAALALTLGIVWGFHHSLVMHVAQTADQQPKGSRLSNVEICEGLVLSQMAGGNDLVRIGKVSARRMRMGPFRLPTRELVVDSIELTLPESYFQEHKPTATTVSAGTTNGVPSAVAKSKTAEPKTAMPEISNLFGALTSGDDRFRQMIPDVAGLRVRGLKISRLEGGTNSVPWCEAGKGKLESENGLILSGVRLFENGRWSSHSEAFLQVKPYLRVFPIQ